MKKYLLILPLFFSALFLSGCGKKKTAVITPTPTPRMVELAPEDRPSVTLSPRSDGHELHLKLGSVSPKITKIEYELTYTAVDGAMEIEKGASGIIESSELINGTITRNILLGTESCTNGCKYKYDTGVTHGNLTLLITSDGQLSTFETPFILRSAADIKKGGGKIVWEDVNFSQTPPKTSPFYVVHRDYQSGEYLINASSQ